MESNFTLFQSHLDLAHWYWNRAITAGDTVIDATCGNGYDTLFLAKAALTGDAGKVLGFDIQQVALKSSRLLLESQLSATQMKRVELIHGSHSTFPTNLELSSVKAIIYNLGYLPGGNKERTTLTISTLESIQNALPLITKGGIICVTCYPGHTEGALEEAALITLAANLPAKEWSCCHHTWINRKKAPSLLLLQRTN